MGKQSNAMIDYFRDNEHFAGLVNGSCFGGSRIVRADDFATPAERMCGMKKTDRLDPTYTICLYHGEEKWEGPRSLKDMMDFGEDGGIWKELFSDYNMHLVCINEIEDFSVYGSPLSELFTLLSVRNDKEALQRLIEENAEIYENMDEETANVANTIVGGEVVMAKREQKYDPEEMCTGLRGIIEDSKNEERARGLQALVESCQEFGATIEAVIAKVVSKYQLSEENASACVRNYWK